MASFKIVRDHMDSRPTTGQLFAEDLNLYTLERPWANNYKGVSCIPTGSYKVTFAWSNRFKKLMPRLLQVPGRDGILIHGGNTDLDTEGCILVGQSRGSGDTILMSQKALGFFVEWLGTALRDGDVYCDIVVSDNA